MAQHAIWSKEYGTTYKYSVLFNLQRFYTEDTTALAYILSHGDIFQKPSQTRKGLSDMLGNGLLTAEGHDHKRQRKLLNSSFSPSAVRDMVPIFFEKGYQLRDKLLSMIDDESVETAPTPTLESDRVKGGRKMDVAKYLAQATLDIIGIAGFDYDFNALTDPKNELAEAYREMFSVGQNISFMSVIQFLVPGARYIVSLALVALTPADQTDPHDQPRPSHHPPYGTSKHSLWPRLYQHLVEEKKKAVRADHTNLEKSSDIGRDLLSILIKANMASNLTPDQRLTDDEVLAQITTFMLAGNETSSTSLTWILYLLSLHPTSQERLRTEVSTLDDHPNMEQLNSLPYLDCVIREALRLLPPAPSTIREAETDVIIPLGKPAQDRNGNTITSVHVSRGTTIFIRKST